MKTRHFIIVLLGVMICLGACQSQPEYCTVKGTVKGLKDGTKLELQDDYNHFKVIATTKVKDGAYEFHPRISAPTHVYMFTTKDGYQLKDFLLEPGTIIADVDATDEMDYATYATGTPSNDLLYKIIQLERNGEEDAAQALKEEVLNAEETGILAFYLATDHSSAAQGLVVLDHLSGDLAAKPYVAELREELTRRARTEPAPEGSESPNYFIDMEFPDINGNLVSLSSVVNNPANRYILLDFWATWCSSCRASIPELQALYEQYHDKGLEIYSVSEDEKEQNWKNFLPESGMTWVNVRDTHPGRSNSDSMWNTYALPGIPTTLIIDGQTGAIIFRDRTKDIATAIQALFQ